jgi:hypothetical protein
MHGHVKKKVNYWMGCRLIVCMVLDETLAHRTLCKCIGTMEDRVIGIAISDHEFSGWPADKLQEEPGQQNTLQMGGGLGLAGMTKFTILGLMFPTRKAIRVQIVLSSYMTDLSAPHALHTA